MQCYMPDIYLFLKKISSSPTVLDVDTIKPERGTK